MDHQGPREEGSVAVSELRRAFGSREVLDGLSLGVEAGTVASVVGANGSGKTTLLRILAGVLDPSAGTVLVAGEAPGRGLAGFVPAGERMLNWRLTARQNLEFFARLHGLERERVTPAVEAAAEALDASELLERRVGQCSTGQRRRVMLAVGFLAGPPVVLLDEPYADLDEEGVQVVSRVCGSWAEGGGVVVHAAPSAGMGPAAGVTFHLRNGRVEASS